MCKLYLIIAGVSLMLFVSFIDANAETYMVNVETLNVRDYPSTDSNVIGQLSKGDVVEFEGGEDWGAVSFGNIHGFVMKRFLSKSIPEESRAKTFVSEGFGEWSYHIKSRIHLDFLAHSSKMPVWIGLVFTIILFFMAGVNDYTGEVEESYGAFLFKMFCFLALCACQLMQFLGYDGDITWFYSPSQIGWGWSVVGFIAFIAAASWSFATLLQLLEDANYHGGRICNFKIGLWSLLIGVIAEVAIAYFKPELEIYTIAFLIITQAAQIIYAAYANHRDGGSWSNLVLCAFLYFLGAFCLSLYAITLIPAILAFIGLLFFARGDDEQESKSKIINVNGRDVEIRNSHGGIWKEVRNPSNWWKQNGYNEWERY